MSLLVMDTSTERAVIALTTDAGGLYVTATETARRHGRDLIPRVGILLDQAGLRARDLQGVVVGLGPGSYTGLRVGVTAAKTLAYVSGARLIGFDSLQAISRNAPADVRRVSVIADAQRGDLCVAEFYRPAPGAGLMPSGNTHVEALSQWIARQEPGSLALGPAIGVPRIRAALPDSLLATDPAWNDPQGERLAELARELWTGEHREDPWLLEPCYLRRSAAEDQFVQSRCP